MSYRNASDVMKLRIKDGTIRCNGTFYRRMIFSGVAVKYNPDTDTIDVVECDDGYRLLDVSSSSSVKNMIAHYGNCIEGEYDLVKVKDQVYKGIRNKSYRDSNIERRRVESTYVVPKNSCRMYSELTESDGLILSKKATDTLYANVGTDIGILVYKGLVIIGRRREKFSNRCISSHRLSITKVPGSETLPIGKYGHYIKNSLVVLFTNKNDLLALNDFKKAI